MFNFPYPLFISSLLNLFVFTIDGLGICVSVGRAWGLKTLTSKYVLSNVPPRTPLAAMSSLAPAWALALAPLRTSPVMG